jgi:hypothetical protein
MYCHAITRGVSFCHETQKNQTDSITFGIRFSFFTIDFDQKKKILVVPYSTIDFLRTLQNSNNDSRQIVSTHQKSRSRGAITSFIATEKIIIRRATTRRDKE